MGTAVGGQDHRRLLGGLEGTVWTSRASTSGTVRPGLPPLLRRGAGRRAQRRRHRAAASAAGAATRHGGPGPGLRPRAHRQPAGRPRLPGDRPGRHPAVSRPGLPRRHRRGVAVEYVQGTRTLPRTGRFDRVISWFTAFGYFNDAGNRQVLAEVPAPSGQEDALPWRCSTTTGLSAPCSRPWSWSATVTCWWTGTGSSS